MLEMQQVRDAYTTAQGVLRTFRPPPEGYDAIRFSNVLPAALRALFVAD
jgi:uncharacterized protein (DUF2267 family)